MEAPSREQTAGAGHPGIIRPRAVKAAQAPFVVSAQFRADCEEAGFSQTAAAHAEDQAAEWHRRWVLQHENGHTMPLDEDAWAAAMQDLRLGAKNPSLSSGDGSRSCSIMSSSPQALAPFSGGTAILRPIAVRPPKPVPMRSEMSPPHILSSGSESPSSPLTVPSAAYGPVTLDDMSFDCFAHSNAVPTVIHQHPRAVPAVEIAKDDLLHALAISGGDVDTKAFADALIPLVRHYAETGWDACDPEGIYSNYVDTRRLEGMWLTLTKASYFGNLGETPAGDPMYTLGRMSFDMFLPTQLVCSLQGNFNSVEVVSPEERAALMDTCPKSLRDDISNGHSVVRKYDIVTAFTIEPNLADFPSAPNKSVRRPIKGIMTTYGYVLPDPAVPNRLSIFFTGGRIEPNDDVTDQNEWNRLFNNGPLPQRQLGEKLRLLAASLLMGAQAPTEVNEDGSMEFEFTRPLGGHGIAYVDVIYLDGSLRIVRGHRGTVFAFVRVADS